MEMFCRSIWDKEFAGTLRVPNYVEALLGRAVEQIQGGRPGHSLREMALCWASWTIAVMDDMGQGWRSGNDGLFKWKPLGASTGGHSGEPLWQYSGVEREEIRDPGLNSVNIKRIAVKMGATVAGVAALDRRWVYSHWWSRYTQRSGEVLFSDETEEELPHLTELEDGRRVIPGSMKYVIVLGFERGYEEISTSPDSVAGLGTGMGYSMMAFTAPTLAEYIRNLGYNAIPAGNDTALSVPMAVDAGLGQLGRNGLLVHPEYGPRLALAKVITDMPLEPDGPIDFGLTEFCEVCDICAKNCPSRAISSGERSYEGPTVSNNPGALKWYLNAENCMRFWTELGEDCSNCLRSCPFNVPPGKGFRLSRWLIRQTPLFNGVLKGMVESSLLIKKRTSAWFYGEE
jgi:reductive dehalogenase